MIKRICTMVMIFLCTSAAWAILGTTIFSRTNSADSTLYGRVASTWGAPQEQGPSEIKYVWQETREVTADENGKKVQYTQKEIDELKIPTNIPGYATSRSDVVPGTFLEVYLLCDKNIPAGKMTDADLRIKYAVIWGKDPNPPKDIANTATSPNKK